MKKKIILLISLISTFSVASIGVLAAKSYKGHTVDGDLVTYTMTLDENNHLSNIESVSETLDRGSSKTARGSDIEFEFSHNAKVESSASFIEFANSGGQIRNLDPINGLIKLEYLCNRDLNLHYGSNPNNLHNEAFLARTGSHSWDPSATYTFQVGYSYPAYFKIDCPDDGQVFLLKFTYSCVATPDPDRNDGVWEYSIHDDYATITGYHIDSGDIPEDGVLTVPYSLGGKTVRFINSDVLANVPWVRHIVLPFVGQTLRTHTAEADGKSLEFGSIFASSNPTGSISYVPIQQHSNTWFIPANLKTVTVTGGNRDTIPNDDYIPEYSFYGADTLTQINIFGPTLPSQSTDYMIKGIGAYAFGNCTGVSEMHLPTSINSIGNNAFAGDPDLVIRSYSSISITDEMNPDFARVTERYADTVIYKGVEYDLYKKDSNTYANAIRLASNLANVLSLDEEIVVEGNTYALKSIANRAFSGCSNLERVYVPAGMEKVGHLAFKGLYKASIILKDEPTSEVYLSNWDQDTGLVVPGFTGGDRFEQDNVSYLPLSSGYFADYIVDETATILPLDQFFINDYVYVSAYFAQSNQNITEISLIKNVVLGDACFFGCSNLATVQYAGTVSEWNALVSGGKIGANVFANTQVTQIICDGGTVPVNA